MTNVARDKLKIDKKKKKEMIMEILEIIAQNMKSGLWFQSIVLW